MRKQITLVLLVLMMCVFGGTLAEENYLKIGSFSEGMAAVQNSEGLWGYIDGSGEIVIPCEWEDAGEFKDGIASVRKDWKYGCINTSGQLVIDCEWKGYSPISFSEGLAPVKNNDDLWGFIDTTGTVIIPCEWEGFLEPCFSEGLAAVEKDGMMGFINKAGEIVIPCQYENCHDFSHGYALVQDDEGFFFINGTGAVAFPAFPRAVQADSFREDGIAFLGFDDNTGVFIDINGRILCTLSEEYRIRSNFHEGLAGIAKQNEQGEWSGCEGYIDRTGTVAIPLELYSSYYGFANGRACIPDRSVSDDSMRYGIIDYSGTLIYPLMLDWPIEFTDTVATAVQDKQSGAINTDGIVVVPFLYDDVKVGDGIILCLREGQISLFDYDGNKLD